MNAPDLLTAALTNLESLEHHVPKLDRPIYLMAMEQIEQARAALAAATAAPGSKPGAGPTPHRPRAAFQPLMDD